MSAPPQLLFVVSFYLGTCEHQRYVIAPSPEAAMRFCKKNYGECQRIRIEREHYCDMVDEEGVKVKA